MGTWEGPYQLMTWGRGYACVSTDRGPRCVPAHGVRPFLSQRQQSDCQTDDAPP